MKIRRKLKKGDVVLSDGLTSSEYRLLTFLVHNNERILEREEIIQAIWDENKSIAGVTDQALDQLIFRLRKKIEDNPNAPSHLQTVKGRGFKFTL
jgi:DNA-binding response OmpR family regulator